VLVKDLTDLGHTEPSRRAFNQPDAQPVLKVRQPAAELGFRLARRPFCRRDPAVPNDLAKVIEVVEIDVHRTSLGQRRIV
jgi:hypothetical protein